MKLSPESEPTHLFVASLAVHLAGVLRSGFVRCCPLTRMMHEPGACSAAYLPGVAGDEQAMILRAMGAAGDTVTRYKCHCGYVFIVANCGNVVGGGEAKCPECGKAIGHKKGAGYNAAEEGTHRMDKLRDDGVWGIDLAQLKDDPGYVGHVEADLSQQQYSVQRDPKKPTLSKPVRLASRAPGSTRVLRHILGARRRSA